MSRYSALVAVRSPETVLDLSVRIRMKSRKHDMDGKRVTQVTAAGSGIGKATALTLAKDGIVVGALGRTRSEIDEAVREIRDGGGRAMELKGDISDENKMRQVFKALTETFGGHGLLR